jgi:hypothetical protein
MLFSLLLTLPLTSWGAWASFTGTNGSLAAAARFDVTGGNLQVALTNTSTADVLLPSQVLTAVFLNSGGVLTSLTASIADLSAIKYRGSSMLSRNVGGGGLTKPG